MISRLDFQIISFLQSKPQQNGNLTVFVLFALSLRSVNVCISWMAAGIIGISLIFLSFSKPPFEEVLRRPFRFAMQIILVIFQAKKGRRKWTAVLNVYHLTKMKICYDAQCSRELTFIIWLFIGILCALCTVCKWYRFCIFAYFYVYFILVAQQFYVCFQRICIYFAQHLTKIIATLC